MDKLAHRHEGLDLSDKFRTGKALILATKPFAEDYTLRSWWCILSTIGYLSLTLTACLLPIPLAARIACSILSGLLVLRLFVVYHDQQHLAILPRSRLAAAMMKVVGLFVLSPSSIWTSSHNHHHNHNSKLRGSNIGSFPVMTKEKFLDSTRSEQMLYLFMRHPLTILFGYPIIFLYGMCFYPFFDKPRAHWDCLFASLIHISMGVVFVLLFGWTTLLLAQTLPALIAGALGSYLFYAQHNFPEVSFHDRAGWTYEKAALESSSYLRTGRLMAWFTGNIGYHHIHHLNAKIPFYRLPEVLKKLPELHHPKTTSLHPVEIIRCLRLKVWDVKAQRMIGLVEAKA